MRQGVKFDQFAQQATLKDHPAEVDRESLSLLLVHLRE
jgi:hypothetical protein